MTSSFALSRHPGQEHLRLAPPRQDHWLGPIGLALLAHGLLVAALTWGVGWKQDAPTPVFEAELWSRLPVQAAPPAEAPPPAPPTPAPEVRPEPRPAPPPPGPSEAQIATQRAQQKKEQEQRAEEAARQKALTEKAAADKAAADKKRAQEQKQAAEDQREREEAAERQRQENIRRMLGQAGASGTPQANGSAQQSAGPSAGYGARVAARIKPNVVFTETVSGNPRAEVEVRTLPDGTIVGRRIVKGSGNTDWDEAVLKAIDRTATLPRDTDGRVPSSLIIGLRPLD